MRVRADAVSHGQLRAPGFSRGRAHRADLVPSYHSLRSRRGDLVRWSDRASAGSIATAILLRRILEVRLSSG